MSDEALHQQTCEACQVGAPLVDEHEFPELLKQIPDWSVETIDDVHQLTRSYSFKNFVDALAFTNTVGALAEEYNHHPEIRTEWGKVTLFWWTHKISGLHKNDFIMAAKSDQVFLTTNK
ncbi:4a-hydroxytetrahydrobiopterin dehydratase [Litoribrevibacter albus]|uniref:Putative pterin-4-alpha-carbinolamine dehydratase n=1 Tax=Litoribrevibacter albus TaxID=1473156 RepID=A0AA37S7Q9_9GAMM|nr:4a-hydroxytetrahydrobiopterin dehydratase [Litoribrevibacter albus]GLQ30810.1 pterin-4-alpha-carbinolamine dehydratase [Litoribrevibacter albus]